MTAELLTALRNARKAQDAATALAVLGAIAPADRDALLRSLPPSLQAWLKTLPAEATLCDLTPEQERDDLIGIIRDYRRLDEPDDCLNVLKALPWASPAEKAEFWRQLPTSLRQWLSDAARHHREEAN